MKKISLRLVVSLNASLSACMEAADKKAVVATAGDIKPFSHQNKKGQLTDRDIQVIKAASKYINGCRIGFKKTV